ncbi:MAG: hypothetical protein IJD22_03080, partial [Clostridia bacterium]|nr:hypothetical protein [Clostridia bacterium]
ALPSGTYTFSGFVEAAGLYGEDAPKISFLSSVNILTSVASRSAKEKGLSVFSVENWLVFYGVMIMFGQFIYLWRDLRAMSKIYGAIMEAGGETFEVIVTTYVNGCYSGQHTELRGGGSPLVALLISVLCFMVFMLTIPIRIIIYIIRDIVFLFKEDYDLDGFSYTGNILGSVGIYVLLFGIVALIGQSTVLGIICTVLGIAMCVVASILCKKKEEEFG